MISASLVPPQPSLPKLSSLASRLPLHNMYMEVLTLPVVLFHSTLRDAAYMHLSAGRIFSSPSAPPPTMNSVPLREAAATTCCRRVFAQRSSPLRGSHHHDPLHRGPVRSHLVSLLLGPPKPATLPPV